MFHIDTLSIVFAALIVLGAIPNFFYMYENLSHIQRKSYFLIHYFSFIISMIGVVIAGNALSFLFFWEIMSLTS